MPNRPRYFNMRLNWNSFRDQTKQLFCTNWIFFFVGASLWCTAWMWCISHLQRATWKKKKRRKNERKKFLFFASTLDQLGKFFSFLQHWLCWSIHVSSTLVLIEFLLQEQCRLCISTFWQCTICGKRTACSPWSLVCWEDDYCNIHGLISSHRNLQFFLVVYMPITPCWFFLPLPFPPPVFIQLPQNYAAKFPNSK